jgi:hypothetical protein
MSGSKYVEQKLFRSTLANARIVMEGSCFSMLSFLYSDCRSLFIFLAFFVMPLYCLSFWPFSLCHCIVYVFGLFRYAIVLFIFFDFSVMPLYCLSFWPFSLCLYCLSFDLQFLITQLVSSNFS